MKYIDMESGLQFPESETEIDYAGKVAETPLLYSYKLLLGGLLFDERVCFDEESRARFSCTDEPKCIGRSRLLAHGSSCVGCAGTADAAACCPFLGDGEEDREKAHGRTSCGAAGRNPKRRGRGLGVSGERPTETQNQTSRLEGYQASGSSVSASGEPDAAQLAEGVRR